MIKPSYNPDWSDDVKSLYRHDMEEYWDKTLVPNKWNQYRNLLNTYLSMASDTLTLDILDVGCAQGTLALLLAEQGHRVCAVDIRQESLDYARSRYETGKIEFIRHNVLEIQLNKKFDIIYANQLIEHLVYPKQMIEQLSSMLKSGGKLVIATPNYFYALSRHPSFEQLGDPKKWEHMQFSADGDGHFFAYKEQELTQIFEDCSLCQINARVFETPFISGHLKARFLHRFVPYKVLKALDSMLLGIPILRNYVSHQLVVTGKIDHAT